MYTFIFKYLLYDAALYMCVGPFLLIYWNKDGCFHRIHIPEENWLFSSSNQQLSIAPKNPSPIQVGKMTGLILCKDSVCSSGCCAFMYLTLTPCLANTVLLHAATMTVFKIINSNAPLGWKIHVPYIPLFTLNCGKKDTNIVWQTNKM